MHFGLFNNTHFACLEALTKLVNNLMKNFYEYLKYD